MVSIKFFCSSHNLNNKILCSHITIHFSFYCIVIKKSTDNTIEIYGKLLKLKEQNVVYAYAYEK